MTASIQKGKIMAKKAPKTRGPKPTWATPKALLADFEAFLAEQKPHPVKEFRNVKRIRKDRKHIKRPTSSDYEWTVEEVETLSEQGRVTIVAFARWKHIHRNTLVNNYSEGKFKEAYQEILGACEDYSEDKLYKAERGANAIIFAMKNAYGWHDKTETELSGAINTPLSDEAKAILAKATRSENGSSET